MRAEHLHRRYSLITDEVFARRRIFRLFVITAIPLGWTDGLMGITQHSVKKCNNFFLRPRVTALLHLGVCAA